MSRIADFNQNIKLDLPLIPHQNTILDDEEGRQWAEKKKKNLELAALYAKARLINDTIISENILERITDCSNFLEYLVSRSGEKKLHKVFFCKNRFCPVCNWRRSRKMFSQVSRITEKIIDENKSAKFLFVTFTQKNCSAEEIKTTLDSMNRAFTLIVDKTKSFDSTKVFKNNLLGYLKAVEITYNSKENTFHPHIHCIFCVKSGYFKGKNYLNKESWRLLWADCMKLDYLPQVKAQTIKINAKNRINKNQLSADCVEKMAVKSAVAETAKYPVKLDSILKIEDEEIKVNALMILHKALKNRRLLTFGGIFRAIKKELMIEDIESNSADLINLGEEENEFNPVGRMLAKYDVKVGAYVI